MMNYPEIEQYLGIYTQIIDVINKEKTFFLSGHSKPDGDTIACELALMSLLKRLNKECSIFNAESVPLYLEFIDGIQYIRQSASVDKSYDVACVFECCDQDRMGNILNLKKQAKVVINMDHHQVNSFYGDINLVCPHVSSNAELVYYLYKYMNITMTCQEATWLYLGIISDTGGFRFSNTTPGTLSIASDLLSHGVKSHLLSNSLFYTDEIESLRLLGFALTKMSFVSGKIAYFVINSDDFSRIGATGNNGDIVNYGLRVPGVQVAVIFSQFKHDYPINVSFRSKEPIDVSVVASQFNGGGHKCAAGCRIEGRSMMDVVSKVLGEIEMIL